MKGKLIRIFFAVLAFTLMGAQISSAMSLQQYVDLAKKAHDKDNKDNQSARAALVFYLEGVADGEIFARLSDVFTHKDDKNFKPYACVPGSLLMNDKLVNQFIELYLSGPKPDMKQNVATIYSYSLRKMYPCDDDSSQ